ncbi:serine--tRNA ligase [Candidatus Woesearchaeota archaeon]|nr:serine--tRNA ligase [Candidatus Woesearchaeota archaeon]
MLDIKFIRENAEIVKKAVKGRGYDVDIDALIKYDEEYRKNLQELEKLNCQRNVVSKEINKLKKEGKDISKKIEEVKKIPAEIEKIETSVNELKNKIKNIMLVIPNLPDKSVPIGKEPEDNKKVREWGKKPKFKFKPKLHFEVGEDLDILDLVRAAKLAGSGFYVFKGLGARLERALINFMLDFHTKDGWVEIFPPELVNEKTMMGTGNLPKFENDLYKTREGLYLIPTAEVPLTNLHAEEVLSKEELPKHYCAYTPCFRTEAGRHGKETRGIFRLHQFDKVEMVAVCEPENSVEELEGMRARAEKLLELLEIPYRTLILCGGDMGFAAAKTYDIEIYAAASDRYLETSSVSNCVDFQARRMNTKFRDNEGNALVHTLNGSGLALPRLMIAIFENYQQEDGSLKIPKVLVPYMGGIKKITKEK